MVYSIITFAAFPLCPCGAPPPSDGGGKGPHYFFEPTSFSSQWMS